MKYAYLADAHGLIRPVSVQPVYPYGERGQTQRDRRISGGRF